MTPEQQKIIDDIIAEYHEQVARGWRPFRFVINGDRPVDSDFYIGWWSNELGHGDEICKKGSKSHQLRLLTYHEVAAGISSVIGNFPVINNMQPGRVDLEMPVELQTMLRIS